jgi:TIR domain/Effector-associated domain 8
MTTQSRTAPAEGEGFTSQLAYFSHSYREHDRDINLFFWRLFNAAGFFFTVDPRSQFFSIPYLESMMSLSNCFVAVIPKREGAPGGCSPYILFEYGLAVQAKKPSLVFVEQGVSGEFFPKEDWVQPFNRNRLPTQIEDFNAAIKSLSLKVRGYRNPDVRLTQPAALVVPSAAAGVYTPELVVALQRELQKYERQLQVETIDFESPFDLSLQLEKYDFLIMECREGLQLPWLPGYVLGRAIPTIKVCHLAAGESPDTVPLPSIVSRHRPAHTDEQAVTCWRDADDLIQGIAAHVAKFGTERIEFHSRVAGEQYFKRAGRRAGRVFISNASSSNGLAHALINRLRRESIDFFHYQVKDAIPVGERWLIHLEEEIEASSVFVALIDPEYAKSRWCLYELQIALKRLGEQKTEVQPFVLDPDMFGLLPALGLGELQAVDISGSETQAVTLIVKAVDNSLKKERQPQATAKRPAAQPPPVAAASPPRAALILSEEQRARLTDILTARLTVEDSTRRSMWIRSLLVRALLYAALAEYDYSGSARDAAVTLVTRAEVAGRLPNGTHALAALTRGLRDQVSADNAPFLDEIASVPDTRPDGQ